MRALLKFRDDLRAYLKDSAQLGSGRTPSTGVRGMADIFVVRVKRLARLLAAFDQCVGPIVCGGAAAADAIRVKVLPGRIAIAEHVADLFAVAQEPGLEPAAVRCDSGRGEAMLFGIRETGR